MVNVKVDLKELPADVGIIYLDKNSNEPRRYYNDVEIDKAWSCVFDQIKGKKDVDLLVAGFMPGIMQAKFTAYCKDEGVKSFTICLPRGLAQCIYNDRIGRLQV